MDPTPVFQRNDAVFLPDGTLLQTHPASRCTGSFCSIHNPSDHPLRDAPQLWDPHFRSIYRMCTHGVIHPDVDDFAYKVRSGLSHILLAFLGAHVCDDCCRWPPTDPDGVCDE